MVSKIQLMSAPRLLVVSPSRDAILLSVGVTGIDTSDNVTLIFHHNVTQLLFWMWQAFMTLYNTAFFLSMDFTMIILIWKPFANVTIGIKPRVGPNLMPPGVR